LEDAFILDQLDQFLEVEKPPTVGVITPFREQVALLSKLVLERPNARDYQDVLKLKIMTFDTCQGEEREVIFYSMVATREHDALNYVFPASLTDTDKVAEDLRLQRLNVGFSRAQECIHFVLSKPIAEFSGSIRTVLHHYRKILDEKDKADAGATDPKSPMEKRLLTWLRATAFYQQNRDAIELRPQFPIGEYLRQLDPSYHHPNYWVEFPAHLPRRRKANQRRHRVRRVQGTLRRARPGQPGQLGILLQARGHRAADDARILRL
jgi:AAA domain